jgi:3D (Asp-Asp-Asp) domain-containing protein
MYLNRSIRRRIAVTTLVALSLAGLQQITVLDSLHVASRAAEPEAPVDPNPAPGVRLRFTATAYCRGTTTASGVNVRSGIAAADPNLLPVGSVVRVDQLSERYDGIYTVMDTGPKVHGRHLDIYIWNCDEAVQLGRREMRIMVLRMGWNPQNSTPTLVERLFSQREAVLPPRRPWPPAEPADAAAETLDASEPDAAATH